jgi:hypothetical protein
MTADALSPIVQSLRPLAERCVVQVLTDDGFGSGFLIAPGQVLTCAHTVYGYAPDRLRVRWYNADFNHDDFGNHAEFDVAEMHLEPRKPGSGPTYAAPDLALLTLSAVPDHPVVWCSPHGPAPLTPDLLSLGFAEDTPAGVAPHTMSLDVVGPSAPPLMRVKSDRVPKGMSGSLVLDGAGTVCGLVKATADDDDRRSEGGWIVPIDAVAAHFPQVMARNAAQHPPGSPWWNLATRREEFTLRIFGTKDLLAVPEPPPDPPPSWWLDPRHQVVPFQSRPELTALLDWARDRRPGTKLVKLLCGPGGAGKTRLAFELARRLQHEGWIAGVRQPGDRRELQQVAEAITAAVERGHRVFVALDYVEGLGKEIAYLVGKVPPASVRILLLARFAGAWWNSFAPGDEAKYLVDHEPISISPLAPDSSGSRDRFTSALQEFRRRTQDRLQGQRVPRGLLTEAMRHRDALNLHALALVTALHEHEHGELPEGAIPWTDPLQELVKHERKHFESAGRRLGNLSDELIGQALLAPTLFAARTADQAVAAVSRIPELAGPATEAARVARLLRDLYPPAQWTLRWWAPLPLDRLAETLLQQVLEETTDNPTAIIYVQALLGSATAWQAVEGLTLLMRVRTRADVPEPIQQKIDRSVDMVVRAERFRLLGSLHLAEQRVLGESPRTAAYVRGLDAVDAAQIAQELQLIGRRSLLEFALLLLEHGARIERDRQPDDSLPGRMTRIARQVAAELGVERFDVSLAGVAFDLLRAQVLVELGRSAEALPLAELTVRRLRRIVEHRTGLDVDQSATVVRLSRGRSTITLSDSASDQSTILARALHVYARALEGQSRDADGLTSRQEAVTVASRAMSVPEPVPRPPGVHRAGGQHRSRRGGRDHHADRAAGGLVCGGAGRAVPRRGSRPGAGAGDGAGGDGRRSGLARRLVRQRPRQPPAARPRAAMTNRPAAAGRRPLFDTARDRLMRNPATWLGDRLGIAEVIAEVTDRAARFPGGVGG